MCLEQGNIFEKGDPLIEDKHVSEVLAAKPPFSRANSQLPASMRAGVTIPPATKANGRF